MKMSQCTTAVQGPEPVISGTAILIHKTSAGETGLKDRSALLSSTGPPSRNEVRVISGPSSYLMKQASE